MQQLNHYSDGTIKVEDTAVGFSATVASSAVEQLIAALSYARTLPPAGEQPVKSKRGRPTRTAKPAAPKPTAKEEAPQRAPKPTVPPAGQLTETIRTMVKVRAYTVAELIDHPKVLDVCTSDDPKRRRAVVAAALTRMVRADEVVNIGDTFRGKV